MDVSAITITCELGCVCVCMYKCVMHFLGLTNNRPNNPMYYLSHTFLSVNKMHVFTSRDESSVVPDQL